MTVLLGLFPSQKVNIFVNLSLNQESRIDYVLVSDASDVSQFTVLDLDINFSDHLPLFTVLTFPCSSFKAILLLTHLIDLVI